MKMKIEVTPAERTMIIAALMVYGEDAAQILARKIMAETTAQSTEPKDLTDRGWKHFTGPQC